MAHKKGFYEKYIKRPQDMLCAGAAILVLSPVMAVTAVLVRVKLGSPVLFRQVRPGRDGKPFTMYKFRSMTDARDENGEFLPDEERLPPFGQKLRSTSLDELPELFNILIGQMALVGPRPLLVQYLPWYTEEEKHRHDVRPGLTGLAQVRGRNRIGWDERLAYDVEYVRNITFTGDLRIVLETFRKVFTHEDLAVDTDTAETYLDEERKERRGAPDDQSIYA